MAEAPGRRTLISIPIAHSAEDMGSLGQRLPADRASRQRSHARWAETRRSVQALRLDWSMVRVFQDGLPDAGVDVIEKILAEVQSPNYEILRWLVAQGAELLGTESPALLREEYSLLQAVLMATDPVAKVKARRAFGERAASLLAARDAYIAQRIDQALPPDGVGILFIGQAHRVTDRLPADVEVKRLPPVTPESRAPAGPPGGPVGL
jgi:hypothetical protein